MERRARLGSRQHVLLLSAAGHLLSSDPGRAGVMSSVFVGGGVLTGWDGGARGCGADEVTVAAGSFLWCSARDRERDPGEEKEQSNRCGKAAVASARFWCIVGLGRPRSSAASPAFSGLLVVKGAHLWGTDVYTNGSDLVAVLMHTGYCSPTSSPPPSAIQELCAIVRVLPPQDSYTSTLRNNVCSRTWGAVIGCSFRIERCCIVKNALRQQIFVREVTIQYNLCNEPWLQTLVFLLGVISFQQVLHHLLIIYLSNLLRHQAMDY